MRIILYSLGMLTKLQLYYYIRLIVNTHNYIRTVHLHYDSHLHKYTVNSFNNGHIGTKDSVLHLGSLLYVECIL